MLRNIVSLEGSKAAVNVQTFYKIIGFGSLRSICNFWTFYHQPRTFSSGAPSYKDKQKGRYFIEQILQKDYTRMYGGMVCFMSNWFEVFWR